MKIVYPKQLENTQDSTNFEILKAISKNTEIVIFSPHLDDAVLSMGSLIYELKDKVPLTIVTAFTKGSTIHSELTTKLLTNAGYNTAEEYFYVRRNEDIKSIALLGKIKIKHLGFVDAAWRGNNNKAFYPKTTLNMIHPDDEKLLNELKSTFSATNPLNATIFAPLGLGKHVDHIFVRNVCNNLIPKVIFYADFPYSGYAINEEDFIKRNKLKFYKWKEGNYSKKAEAITQYNSQLKNLFPNEIINLPFEEYYLK